MAEISREELQRISLRRDTPAVLHLVIQTLALLAAAAATARLAAAHDPARWIAVGALGVCILSFFPLLHETGHRTAFASRLGNEIGVWLGAVMMLQAPSFFREFHWEHHRSTQDPALDPEISSAPGLLDGWPGDPVTYLALVSGQGLLVAKLGFTLACALLPRRIWTRLFPFVRPNRARRVAWESRVVLGVLAAFVGVGWSCVPGFGSVLLGWPLAHVLLGFYLMPEHTGLPHQGTQVARTRTVASNAALRGWMWNMPYHAEHHAHPGVPYHALPTLHARLAPALEHTSRGYLAFHAEALRRALRCHRE